MANGTTSTPTDLSGQSLGTASTGLPQDLTPTAIPSDVMTQFLQAALQQANAPEQLSYNLAMGKGGSSDLQKRLNALQQGWAGTQYGFTQRREDLAKQQQVDLPTEMLNFQKGQLPEQQALTRQLQVEIPGEALKRQLALQPRLHDIQQQQYALQQQGYGLEAQALDQQAEQVVYDSTRQLQQAMGGEAARGATGTIGAARQLEDIAKQKGWSQKDIERAKGQLGLTEKGAELGQQSAEAQFGETMAGLSDQQKSLLASSGLLDLSQQAQTFQLGEQEKGIGLVAKGLGITSDEAKAQLQNSIDTLGLSGQITQEGILGGAAQAALGQYPADLSTINQVLGMSFDKLGVPADVKPQDLWNKLFPGQPMPTPGQSPTIPGVTPVPPPAAPAAPAPKPAPAPPPPAKAQGGTRSGQQP
jgi:hypothetical protein